MSFNTFIAVVGALVLANAAANAIRNGFNIGLDDSDLDSRHRSGLAISTDYKTGLQYLRTPGGGITPRLDTNGNHMKAEG